MKATDPRLQKSLVELLEDPAGELGLTGNWDDVTPAVNLLVKRQKRVDKLIVDEAVEEVVTEKTTEKVPGKSTTPLSMGEPVLDDLIKGIQELNLNLKAIKFEEHGSTSVKKPTSLRSKGPMRCIWCDSLDHMRKDCDDFNDSYSKRLVFWKDGKIHLVETGQPI